MLVIWYVLMCNTCGQSALRGDGGMFTTAAEAEGAALSQGWRLHTRQDDKGWVHHVTATCAACLERRR